LIEVIADRIELWMMKRERAPERRGPGEGDRMALLAIFALVSRRDGSDNPID
jgi:hypothetical protein